MTVEKGLICLVTAESMGSGDHDLGKTLMLKFLAMATEQHTLPEYFLFVNSGVRLLENVEALAFLKTVELKGSRMIFCGTCINHFKLLDKVTVGTVGNMRQIQEMLFTANKTVTI